MRRILDQQPPPGHAADESNPLGPDDEPETESAAFEVEDAGPADPRGAPNAAEFWPLIEGQTGTQTGASNAGDSRSLTGAGTMSSTRPCWVRLVEAAILLMLLVLLTSVIGAPHFHNPLPL